MHTERGHILLFTRYPEPGTTKTRLIPRLGSQGAADMQKRLTEHIYSQARSVSAADGVSLDIWYCGGTAQKIGSWLKGADSYQRQCQGDIGQRMRDAFRKTFSQGGTRVVLIGSDIPGLNRDILRSALSSLLDRDAVIGPAEDGGYYLVGLSHARGAVLADRIFTDIPWSTDEVYPQTVSVLNSLGASFAALPLLRDIDRPEDLEELYRWITP